MENTIAFTVKGSGNLFYLSAGKSLINFIEFDIAPFYRECQDMAEEAARTGGFDEKNELMVKDLLRNCHPYFAACYNGVFDRIVLDCVIDIVCHMEGVGLEAMWAKYISAEDTLGKEIFARISDYKTGHAVNQWANLQRMQKYAQKKVNFIFGEHAEDPVQYDVRAMYFDLAFSTAADIAGCGRESAPAIRCTPTGLLSAAPEMFSPVSSMTVPMLGNMPDLSGLSDSNSTSECIRELRDGMICVELMKLALPDKLEMVSITKKLKELPRRTYVPESLKAAIDLEIDELLERKLTLEPLPGLNRFELRPMYRPAPPPPPMVMLSPREDQENAPSVEIYKEAKPAEEQLAETDSAAQSEEIAEIKPEMLYQAIEPEPEIGAEFAPEIRPEPEHQPTTEPETISANQPEPESSPKPRRGRPKGNKTAKVVFEPESVQVQKDPEEQEKLVDKPKGPEEQPKSDPRRETEDENRTASASKIEVKRIAAPIAEITMLTDSSYGRKPRKDRRAASMEVPPTTEARMQLLQKLAADRRRSVRRHEGQDVDIFCQSVHTALSAALRDQWNQEEEEKWAKLLFRIRGGVMTHRYSTEYLYRFLNATVEMYSLELE